jgi:hypothetical protein
MQTTFQEPAVLNWNRVIHKNVRTKEGEPLGHIAAEEKESIVVLASGQRVYRIPKFHVEEFNGSEVYLDLTFMDVAK